MSSEKMQNIVGYIKKTHGLVAIPVRVKNEKRWESMDEIIEKIPFEGVPQRVDFCDGFGVIIYDWDIVDDVVLGEIKKRYLVG